MLQQEHAELQRQFESAPGEADDRPVDDIALELQQRDADLCAKAKRIAEVAEHLYRRQRRLKALLRAHRQRTRIKAAGAPGTPGTPGNASVAMEEHARNVRRIDRARQELTEVRDALAVAERRMVRRWAAPRAIFITVWIAALLAASGVASWFAADHYFPAVVSASVTFEAKGKHPGALEPEEAERWRDWHLEYIASDPFRTTLAQRCTERRIDALDSVGAVHTRLERDMTIDASQPQAITVTLAGVDSDEVVSTLDVLATTLMTESTKRLRHRTDGTWAVAKDHPDSVTGQKRFASLNATPIEDQRLHYASVMFGGVFASLALIVGTIVLRLLKVKREFDADGALFEESVGPIPGESAAL